MGNENKSVSAALELSGPVKIVRAFKPGDVVFIESTRPLNRDAMAHVSAEFKRMLPDLKVVVLSDGLKVAGREEDWPWLDLLSQWRAKLEGVAVDSDAFEVTQEMDELLRGLRAGGSL